LVSGRKVERISPEALEALQNYPWPGNIRQLESAIERAVALGESADVEAFDLPPEILRPAMTATQSSSAAAGSDGGSGPIIPEASWEEHEKAKILEALQRTNWNITRAAQLLGMTFRTLQYRLEKFGIKKP